MNFTTILEFIIKFIKNVFAIFHLGIVDFLNRIKKTELEYFFLYVLFFVVLALIIGMYLQHDGNLRETSSLTEINVSSMLEAIKTYQENQHRLEEQLIQVHNEIVCQQANLNDLQWNNRVLGIVSFVIISYLAYRYLFLVSDSVAYIMSAAGGSSDSSFVIYGVEHKAVSGLPSGRYEIQNASFAPVLGYLDAVKKSLNDTLIIIDQEFLKTGNFYPKYSPLMKHVYENYYDTVEMYQRGIRYIATLPASVNVDSQQIVFENMKRDVAEICRVISDKNIYECTNNIAVHLAQHYPDGGLIQINEDPKLMELCDKLGQHFDNVAMNNRVMSKEEIYDLFHQEYPDHPSWIRGARNVIMEQPKSNGFF